jgi:hypothetical protein
MSQFDEMKMRLNIIAERLKIQFNEIKYHRLNNISFSISYQKKKKKTPLVSSSYDENPLIRLKQIE